MYFIFDFDGTLVDSLFRVIDKFNLLAEEFNFKKIHADEIIMLRDFSSRELLRYLQIPIYKLPLILFKGRKYLQHDMHMLPPIKNMPQILLELKKRGYFLGVVTSNSQENVNSWLRQYDIYSLFTFVHSESSYFGKRRILNKLLKVHQINNKKAFYIGDETRDVNAAKQCGIYSVAVTWGFNSEKALEKCSPHFILHQPEELLTLSDQFS